MELKKVIEPTYPYTIDEAADIMHVHRETVKEWYQEGKLGMLKLGYRTVRILGQDLITFLESSREEANFVKRVNLKEVTE